jgi:hypothetical protein
MKRIARLGAEALGIQLVVLAPAPDLFPVAAERARQVRDVAVVLA